MEKATIVPLFYELSHRADHIWSIKINAKQLLVVFDEAMKEKGKIEYDNKQLCILLNKLIFSYTSG